MLGIIRDLAGTWVSKALLSVLVLSFAVWGISGRIAGSIGDHESVITVGDTTVSVSEYRLAYDQQINMLSQQFGQRLTREQATALGIDNQVLSQLVSGAVLDEQARKLSLGLSKDRLAQLVGNDPSFKGPGGGFDRQTFEYMLQQAGMRPSDYLRTQAQMAKRRQIIEAVTDGLKTPDTFLKAVALYRGEDRTIDYLVLPRSLVEPVSAPTESDLSAYFDENKKVYAAPEYRKFSYIRLEPEDIMDTSAITDQQVREDYEKNKARYTTPEMRTIEQVVFKSREGAEQALGSLKSGATFDKIVAAEGKTGADIQLGTLPKDQIADKAVADAAFSLGVNEVSQVVDGAFGPVLLRVTAIKPEVVKALADVSDEIRKDLALGEANRVLLDVHDSYEDARAGGATLQEAAARLKLKVVTVEAVDRAGQTPDGTIVKNLPASEDLIKAVFDAEPGTENEGLTTNKNGYVFYEVVSTTPARDRTLDEVRQKVVANWTAVETEKRLQAKAQDVEKQIKGGAAIDTVAAELSLEKQTKRGLKRGSDDADFGRNGATAMFGVAEGGTGVVETPTGDGKIVFKVAEVFEPAGAGASSIPEDEQKSFTTGISNDLLEELVADLQAKYRVSVDQIAISQALAR